MEFRGCGKGVWWKRGLLVEKGSDLNFNSQNSSGIKLRVGCMISRKLVVVLILVSICGSTTVDGQDNCECYKLVPQTTFRTQPVTMSQLIQETVMKPQRVTTFKPVWTRETRHRRTTVLKPIVETSEREERFLVRRPIIETSFRERQIEETCFETVTEMREQRWLVERPVVETQLREEQVVVQRPVTTTMMQTENVTTMRPVTVNETQFVASSEVCNDVAIQTGRNRLRWLQPGTYVDPRTGQTAFRNRGLHWVPDQQLVLRPTVTTTLMPQQVERTVLIPETVQVQRPVQVTQSVQQIETRKVPVQVTRTSREIQVTQTPVTVQKPVTRTRTEKIPVQNVTYQEEILTRRVPVTETRYERVEQVEPYEVEVCRWVAETREILVPTVVTRCVDHSFDQLVPETVVMRVPVDVWGNAVVVPSQIPIVQSQTVARFPISERILSAPVIETYKPLTSAADGNAVVGERIIVRKLEAGEFPDHEPQSILVPETGTDPDQPASETVAVKKPPTAAENAQANDKNTADEKPELQSIAFPSNDDPGQSTDLNIDSSDAADIDSRPSDPADPKNDDEIPLNGSN